jgi:myo-inositol-hexaphosphate 3-phosphohydrolase
MDIRNNYGTLLVAEAPPNADDSAVVVHPHPDSRIFMTVVRAHGSKVCDRLSNAVRNRALEICLRCLIGFAIQLDQSMPIV